MRAVVRAVAGAALSALVLVAGLGLGVGAQEEQSEPLTIRGVDATDPSAVKVTFTYEGNRNDLSGLTVRESGDLVAATSARPLSEQQGLGIVLAIDVSGSMSNHALIERVLEAARAFVSAKAATDQIAIVTFNAEVRVLQEFTADKEVLLAKLESLPLAEGTAIYDGIIRSAALFKDSELQPNVIVFSDGSDTASKSDASRAAAAVERVGGALFALGLENSGFAVLERMAVDTGGVAAVASDPAGVQSLFEDVQATLQKQYIITYESHAEAGTVPIRLAVGKVQASAEVIVGSEQEGAARVQPQVVEKPGGPAFLRSPLGLLIGVLLAMVAVTVAALSLGATFLGREHTLDSALLPYGEGFGGDSEFDEDTGGDGRAPALAQTPLLQRAVKATGEFAERQGFLEKVEGLLERANLPLRPAEAIFFYFAGVVIAGVLLLALTRSPFSALVGLVLLAITPPAILSTLARRRQKAFDSQLPDMLQLLASTLRAGYSLMQGVEAVSQEVGEPIGRELRRVVTEARLGRPLEESLEQVAQRMDSPDFAWAVMAIRIQREVGGNLAELLVTVAETMTERERLRRDVNALTAEGRVSAMVLGLLPVGIGLFIMGANPGYLDPLFDNSVGKIMLVGAGILMAVGFYWMKKTIEVEI